MDTILIGALVIIILFVLLALAYCLCKAAGRNSRWEERHEDELNSFPIDKEPRA